MDDGRFGPDVAPPQPLPGPAAPAPAPAPASAPSPAPRPRAPAFTARDLARAPVTTAVLALAIATTLTVWTTKVDLAMTALWWREPWRFLSSTLVHVDVMHLGFNAYWTWVLGRRMEAAFGKIGFLALLLFLAVGSTAADFAFDSGGVGLSGVGYGLFGVCWAMRRDPRLAGLASPSNTRLFAGWFVLCVILTHAGIWRVGNWAHGSGAVLGLAAGFALDRRGAARIALLAASGALAAGFVALLPFRAKVNLSPHDAAAMSAWQAYQALEAEDAARCAPLFRDAVALDPGEARNWYDLGICEQMLGRYDDAKEDYRRALALKEDPRYQSALDALEPPAP